MADTHESWSAPEPSDTLKPLGRLVGTWELSGDSSGTVTYRWMEGGFFLIQDVDITVFGHPVRATEYIGHLRPFGQAPSADIHSWVFDTQGNTLDYVYELEGDTLTIWGGFKGSPAYFKGTFTDDDTNEGSWVYPGGGGYSSIMKRTKRAPR
ncbi:MAG: hypothetical protein JNL73_16100 [Anaerolineales bacterium]|nr:hypothetical protein [Anaerolineales bacterium]